ncbi:hypothetical protein AURANDRAFT_67687 [Aureococcus anophagefferens]|uniref:JmjC domain-containing protein n=1 Tax=Aureococcus anophagefferens TaxID=44056 RepID=F0YM23_AURAN|nr:hypothetical protein AURANDRAFT_67687 [Aureococcus anophagefferens]EGB03837.1 hypothetical protein AURANDRAFT_67687 [Aureococcus anophagefferens]|eukprot:XP_009041495.1 hypothetical protein AURANDRAFT_67687 [Aureococcus anophagefferens]
MRTHAVSLGTDFDSVFPNGACNMHALLLNLHRARVAILFGHSADYESWWGDKLSFVLADINFLCTATSMIHMLEKDRVSSLWIRGETTSFGVCAFYTLWFGSRFIFRKYGLERIVGLATTILMALMWMGESTASKRMTTARPIMKESPIKLYATLWVTFLAGKVTQTLRSAGDANPALVAFRHKMVVNLARSGVWDTSSSVVTIVLGASTFGVAPIGLIFTVVSVEPAAAAKARKEAKSRIVQKALPSSMSLRRHPNRDDNVEEGSQPESSVSEMNEREMLELNLSVDDPLPRICRNPVVIEQDLTRRARRHVLSEIEHPAEHPKKYGLWQRRKSWRTFPMRQPTRFRNSLSLPGRRVRTYHLQAGTDYLTHQNLIMSTPGVGFAGRVACLYILFNASPGLANKGVRIVQAETENVLITPKQILRWAVDFKVPTVDMGVDPQLKIHANLGRVGHFQEGNTLSTIKTIDEKMMTNKSLYGSFGYGTNNMDPEHLDAFLRLKDLYAPGLFTEGGYPGHIIFGSANDTIVSSSWHNAIDANLLFQLCGDKLWHTTEEVPSDVTPFLVFPSASGWFHKNQLIKGGRPWPMEIDASDHVSQVVLHAGDLLINPPYSWHAVKIQGPSVSLSVRGDKADVMTWMSYKYFAGNVNHPILMAFAVYLDDFYNYKKLSESTVARFFKMIFPNLVKTAYALFQAKSIRIHNALRDKFQQYQDSGQESCSAVNQDMYEVLNTDCSDYWTHRLEVSLVGRISRIQHALDLCHSDRSTQLLVIHPKITHDLVRCPLLVTNRQFDARLHSPPSFGANEAPARAALPSSAQYFKKKLKLIVIEFIAYTIPESEISLEQQITISSAFARAEHFSFDLLEPDDADVELTFEQRYEQEYLHAEHDGASAKSAASCADEADFHVREFLRFLALKSVRPDVTPSVVVDNVFHLALTYTVAYAHLCALVGGTFIHHDPTPGGDAANARYMRQYEDALELYALAFGAPPPRSVWPPVAERMDPQRDYVSLPRSRVQELRAAAMKSNIIGGVW